MSLSSDGTVMTMPVTPAYGGGYGNGMWGGDWGAWILLFLLFGFGRGGWGGFGNESSCCAPASCADLQRGFDNQSVMNKLNGIEQGISQAGYAALQQTNTLENGLCQLGYQTQTAINAASVSAMQDTNALSRQLADCCCENRLAICNLTNTINQGFNGVSNTICNTTRDVIDNQNANYRALSDQLTAFRMEDKDNQIRALENQVNALNLAVSQRNQNETIINTLRPCPVPSYPACNPWAGSGYGGCGTYSSCGC